MLKKLVIKNLALIDSVEIDFTKNLNILSGETGAGKSVIIDSLNFVLGAKADKSLIRSGESECFVKAIFDVTDNDYITSVYNELDLEQEDDLIITRKYTIDGKNSIKINGETANNTILKKFTQLLVDVHGQSEHFHLLKTTNQLQLIDDFGGQAIFDIKNQLREKYLEYKNVNSQLNTLGGDENQRLIRLDILNFQINEIESVSLQEGEEEELLSIKNKLLYQQKIVDALNAVKTSINNDGGISDMLSISTRLLDGISGFSQDYTNLFERLNGVYSELDDIASQAGNMLDDIDSPNFNIDEIEDRLEIIKNLKKKYGKDYLEINKFLENVKSEKNKLDNFNELAEKLLISQDKLKKELYKTCTSLSNERKKHSKILSENVVKELHELGMTKSNFAVEFEDLPEFDACNFDCQNGMNKIEFLFSANLGEPLKSLSNIISGGEMSRFMLSIKVQTVKHGKIKTFIFDEIDAGISGVTARAVAEKLARISKDVQVIAITHLPQISAMGDNNLLIVKNENGERTLTTVTKLSYDDKIKEITRLIGGFDSDSSNSHAKELIELAENYKKTL